MQQGVLKILIAFIAGLMIAGGGAYLYSNLHHGAAPAQQATSVPNPIPQQTAQTTAPPVSVPPVAQPETPVPETPSAIQPAVPPKVERHKVVPKRKHRAEPESESAPPPSTLVENPPAAPVATAPAPPPATAEQPPAPQQALMPPSGTQTAPPPPREPQVVTLAAGTPLTIRLNETVSSDRNYSGDTFTATLDAPIIRDGAIIADRGSRVTGRVVQAERAGRVKGLSTLELALTQLHTTDGQRVNIQTAPWNKQGEKSGKRDAAEVAGGAALGAIIGAIAGGGKGAAIGAGAGGAGGTGVVLTQRGKETVVPAETRITFNLAAPVTIRERLN